MREDPPGWPIIGLVCAVCRGWQNRSIVALEETRVIQSIQEYYCLACEDHFLANDRLKRACCSCEKHQKHRWMSITCRDRALRTLRSHTTQVQNARPRLKVVKRYTVKRRNGRFGGESVHDTKRKPGARRRRRMADAFRPTVSCPACFENEVYNVDTKRPAYVNDLGYRRRNADGSQVIPRVQICLNCNQRSFPLE